MSDYYEDGFNRVRGPFLGHNGLGLREREDEKPKLAVRSAPPLKGTIERSQRAAKKIETFERPCKCCKGGTRALRPEVLDEDDRCPVCHGKGMVIDERPKRRAAAGDSSEAREGVGLAEERA